MRLGGLFTGVVVALAIWILDIENPNRIAVLALVVGAVVSAYDIPERWHTPRAHESESDFRGGRPYPCSGNLLPNLLPD
jgi:hypothetical protein